MLREQFEQTVRKDNCAQFEEMSLQIPAVRHRCHYIKVKVKVLRHTDGTRSIRHGPRVLARYSAEGKKLTEDMPVAAQRGNADFKDPHWDILPRAFQTTG